MIKTAQRYELALSLDDLDAVVGGSASPSTYFHPVAIQSTSPAPAAGFSSITATPSADNNFGLASHFDLMFPAMLHDSGHVADGIAPGLPGGHGAPSASTDAHDTAAALPLSFMAVPGGLSAPATLATVDLAAAAAPAAATAPADTAVAIYLGLPGGADLAHGDASHPVTNAWAPGSFTDGAPATGG